MIVNHPAGDGDLSHLTIDLVFGLDQTFFDRRRVRNDLEGRSRLINILQRAVGARFRCLWPADSDRRSERSPAPESRRCADP